MLLGHAGPIEWGAMCGVFTVIVLYWFPLALRWAWRKLVWMVARLRRQEVT